MTTTANCLYCTGTRTAHVPACRLSPQTAAHRIALAAVAPNGHARRQALSGLWMHLAPSAWHYSISDRGSNWQTYTAINPSHPRHADTVGSLYR